MSTTEHTPGPWEWRFVGEHPVLWGAHGFRPIVLDFVRKGMTGATVRLNRDDAMRKATSDEDFDHADARLIAAAPELLAACEAGLSVIESLLELVQPGGVEADEVDAIAKLEAAIAKAKPQPTEQPEQGS